MALPAGFTLEQPQVPTMQLPAGFQLEQPASPKSELTWGEVPGQMVKNLVPSALHAAKGVATAVAHPIDTIKGLADLATGAALHASPKEVVDWFKKNGDSEQVKKIMDLASSVGGQYAKDYGSLEGIKQKLAKDPVGVASDLSTLLTGGAAAASKVGIAAPKVAAIENAARLANPMTPVVAGIDKVMPVVARGAGAVADYFNPQQKAATIARQAAGENLNAIRAANAAAPADLTAAQAAGGVVAPTYQALAANTGALNIDKAYPKELAQAAAREAALQNVTPDMAAALAAREQAGNVAYGRAFTADQQRLNNLAAEQQNANMLAGTVGPMGPEMVTPALQSLKSNPVIKAAAKEATTLAETKGINLGDPMTSLEGLHYMKIAIDNQFKNRTASTALQNYSDAALNNTKDRLLAAIEGTANQPGVSPMYGLARQQHAVLSEPVNQAEVLNAMQGVLKGPMGAERAKPFMNVMGQGENALLKKANQNPRFGGIEDVLTPEQMSTVKTVAGELTRDEKIAREAGLGRSALSVILDQNKSKFRLPNFFSAKTTLANETISILEGKLDKKVLDSLKKGFESGADMNELLTTVPSKDKNKILVALGKAQSGLSPEKLNALGLSANALAPEQKRQNALRIELRGMANKE